MADISGTVNQNNSSILGTVSNGSQNFNGKVGVSYDKTYVFTQATASATWNINHKLNKFCSVTVVDSANNVVIGDVQYTDKNNVVVSFSAGFAGKAYCN